MKQTLYTILFVLSIVMAIISLWGFIYYGSGHVDIPKILGLWILPLMLFLVAVCIYISIIFWKLRNPSKNSVIKKELISSPIKIIIICGLLFLGFIIYKLTIIIIFGILPENFPDSLSYIFHPFCIGLTIYLCYRIYKRIFANNNIQ